MTLPLDKKNSQPQTILIIGAGSKVSEAITRVLAVSPTKHKIYYTTSGMSKYAVGDNEKVFAVDFTNRKDIKELCQRLQPNIIINTAAYTDVDKSELERQKAWLVNVVGVENLVAVCRLFDAHLVHFSTDYVFDGDKGPYSETDVPQPLGYYAKTKLAGENICIGGNIDYTLIRTNVLYGATLSQKHDFVLWTLKKLAENKTFGVVNDQYSNPTLIDDIGCLVEKVIRTGAQGVYHAAGKDWISRFEFAKMIAKVFRESEQLIQPISTSELQQTAPRPLRGGLIPYKAEVHFGMKFSGIENGLYTMRRQLQVFGNHEWKL